MKMKSHQNEASFLTRDVLENSSPFLDVDVEICHETNWNCDSLWGTPSKLIVVVCPCIHTCDGWWQKWIVEVSGQHTLNGMFVKRNLKKQRYVLKAFITIYQKLSDGRLMLTTMDEVTSPVVFLYFKTRSCWLLLTHCDHIVYVLVNVCGFIHYFVELSRSWLITEARLQLLSVHSVLLTDPGQTVRKRKEREEWVRV